MLSQRHAILIYKMKTISIHDNETSKIYTDLNPAVSQDPQTYHMKKLTEIEAYFLDEIEVRQILTKKKKMKRFNTIISVVDAGLITTTVVKISKWRWPSCCNCIKKN